MSDVAIRLRKLRETAGLSLRQMGEFFPGGKSKYEHYEARYKKPYLPADIAALVADALRPHGIPTEDVMALAGPSAPDVPADTLNLAGRYSSLSPQRQRAMRDLLEALEAAETLDRGRLKADEGDLDRDDTPAT